MKEIKEEAERIIQLFKPYAEGKPGFALEKQQAKQCALICLNEKIKTANKYSNNHLGDLQEFQELEEYIQKNY